MDKVLILASPIAPMQQVFIYKNGAVMEQLGIAIDNLTDVIVAIHEEYDMNNIELSGNHSFTLGLQEQITKKLATEYEVSDITITCI